MERSVGRGRTPGIATDSRHIRCTAGFGKARGTLTAIALLMALGLSAGAASALPSAPSLKPKPEISSSVLPGADFQRLHRALDAADEGRWSEVRTALARISDPAAKALLRWRMSTDAGSAMPFSELSKALEEYANWPDVGRIGEQAEVTIINSALSPTERIGWLRSRGPRTGDGVLALADALDSEGRRDEMAGAIRNAWRTMLLPDGVADRMQARYSAVLTQEDHWARADMLLWRGQVSEAQRLLPRVSDGQRRVAEARMALRANRRNVDAIIEAVPSAYANDPGLLFERARWRERKGLLSGELEMLLKIRGEDAAPAGRRAIWEEKQQVMRRILREGDISTAYTLAAGHGLTSGEEFREAEWSAGWLALRLKDPIKAEQHLRTFLNGVSTPISVARGQYWLGEALAAQNRDPEAQAAYEAAARFPFVFYGQLAAEKASREKPELRMLSFAASPAPTEAERAAFAQRTDVRAAVLLAETGRLNEFERFSNAIDDQLSSAVEHQMLFDIGQTYLETRAAVRGAKAGLGRGLIAPDAVFPVLKLPPTTRNGAAEEAMVLALARQESELYPRAISSADARGMMQIIPRTAEAQARKVGLPYRSSWLTDDPGYNFRLGRGFLDDLVTEFGGSYILAAAAYNAGPSRARQWIEQFGDPRTAAIDPVTWIETIPFEETRNYVQRVLENTQVYRHRLSGEPVRINLSRDIARGRP